MVQDSFELNYNEVDILTIELGVELIPMGHYLCIDTGTATKKIKGKKTKDPAFGISAMWIEQTKKDKAKSAGYTVADPPGIIATHLSEIIKRNAADILGLQDTQNILDRLSSKYPTVVKEATREDRGLGVVEIWRILQGLLKENVSIRNMVSILESIAVYVSISKDIRFHIEKARLTLAKQICSQYADAKDPDKTAYQWTIIAEQGDTDAMIKLGTYFYQKTENRYVRTENQKTEPNKAVIAGDLHMAEHWFTEAAKRGDVQAQFVLGAYYHLAENGPKDFSKAVFWYNKAANQGNSKAQFFLGNCYHKGEGVQKDQDRAVYWWSLAAAQGNDEAKKMISGIKYERL